jgi:group I intron endonuclease
METIDINIVKGIIYKIVNNINGKIYIGQTLTHSFTENLWYPTGAMSRWAGHIVNSRSKRRKSSPFCDDLVKLGPDNFTMTILELCEVEDVNEKEKYYIKKFQTIQPNGYNCLFGTSEINPTKQKILLELNIETKEPKLETPADIKLKRYTKQLTIKRGVDRLTFLKNLNIECVDIKPIKRNGEYNTIRLLIAVYGSTERYRLQFGNKPLKTKAFEEVLELLEKLDVPKNKQNIDIALGKWLKDKDTTIHFINILQLYENEKINRITVSPHKQNKNDYIRIIIHREGDKKEKDMKRHVLGSKRDSPSLTYKRVLSLIEELKKKQSDIYIIDKCSQLYSTN